MIVPFVCLAACVIAGALMGGLIAWAKMQPDWDLTDEKFACASARADRLHRELQDERTSNDNLRSDLNAISDAERGLRSQLQDVAGVLGLVPQEESFLQRARTAEQQKLTIAAELQRAEELLQKHGIEVPRLENPIDDPDIPF